MSSLPQQVTNPAHCMLLHAFDAQQLIFFTLWDCFSADYSCYPSFQCATAQAEAERLQGQQTDKQLGTLHATISQTLSQLY
jgi:hypothetical protein